MARVIDKDYLLTHKRKVRFFGIGPDDESWGYAVPVEVIENAPTLTPPNEPLTLDELRKMDGQPVWVDDKKTWALLQVWDDKNIDVVFPMPKGCFHAKSVNGKKIYRRPPEGEENI